MSGLLLSVAQLFELQTLTARPSHISIHLENLFDAEPPLRECVLALKRECPIFLHATTLGIGSDALCAPKSLEKMREVIDWVKPEILSAHIAFNRAARTSVDDLLPLERSQEALELIVSRSKQLTRYFEQELVLENISAYVHYKNDMSESAFLNALAQQGVPLLLDVNNLFVNQTNGLNCDARLCIDTLPKDSVREIHIAGAAPFGDALIDAHDRAPSESVMALAARAQSRFEHASLTLEWDQNPPPIEELLVLARRKCVAREDRLNALVRSPLSAKNSLFKTQEAFFESVLSSKASPHFSPIYRRNLVGLVSDKLARVYPRTQEAAGDLERTLAAAFMQRCDFIKAHERKWLLSYNEFLHTMGGSALAEIATLERAIFLCSDDESDEGWAQKLKKPFELLNFRTRGTLLPLSQSVRDVCLPEHTFENAHTHLLVLFDEGVRLLGLSDKEVQLYRNLRATHKEMARAIAAGWLRPL